MSGFLQIIMVIWMVTSWATHLITCFTEESWGFLIAGALMFPIAIFHGTWIWFT